MWATIAEAISALLWIVAAIWQLIVLYEERRQRREEREILRDEHRMLLEEHGIVIEEHRMFKEWMKR
jgi:hypothetical protein